MSACKGASKKNCGKKIQIIGYGLAAVLAAGGAALSASGVANAHMAIIVALWVALLTFIVSLELKKIQKEKRSVRTGMINLPYAGSEYMGKDYRAVASLYTRLGFRNVTTVSLHDLKTIMVSKPGSTESVTIGGEKVSTNEWYDPDAEVVITYHDFAE